MALKATFYDLAVSIEYNPGNNRFTGVFWNIPTPTSYHVTILENGTPIYETTLVGPTSGNTNIFGNRRVVEVIDEIDQTVYIAFPPGLTIEVEKL